MGAKKRIRKVLNWLVLTLLLLAIYPLISTYNYISNDRNLKSYIKHTSIPAIQERMFGSGSVDTDESRIGKEIVLDEIQLILSDSTWLLLQGDLEQRLNQHERLGSNSNPWRQGAIRHNDTTFDCKIKLRGDTRDNYQYGLANATFRVNIKGSGLIKGCKKFSFIRPFHENGLYGMMYYDFARSQGILSNSFEFVRLKINDRQSGVWIFQEAFHSKMLERQKQGRGIIMKFENDCVENEGRYNPSGFPRLNAYGMKGISDDSIKMQHYRLAVRGLNQLYQEKIEMENALDIQKWADFVAINDIFNAHHSMTCHNTRFYFNPVSNQIEPVAWDPFCYKLLPKEHSDQYFSKPKIYPSPVYKILRSNPKFVRLYKESLWSLLNDGELTTYLRDCYPLNAELGHLLHEPIVTPGLYPDVFKKTTRKLKDQFYVAHPFKVVGYIKQHELEIINMTLLPMYCEKIEFGDSTLVLDRVICDKMIVPMSLEGTKQVKCIYRSNMEDTMLVENAVIYDDRMP